MTMARKFRRQQNRSKCSCAGTHTHTHTYTKQYTHTQGGWEGGDDCKEISPATDVERVLIRVYTHTHTHTRKKKSTCTAHTGCVGRRWRWRGNLDRNKTGVRAHARVYTRTHTHNNQIYKDAPTQRVGGKEMTMVSRINKIIGLFCKRALLKRRYSAKET